MKKKTSGRVSVNDESQVDFNGSTQSANERRSAEAELRALIDTYAPAHLRLVNAVRKFLQKRLPTAYEIVYEYRNQGAVVISLSPNEHGYEGVLVIRVTADAVKLYFNRGGDLPDPEKLLQGSANTRWINVERASTLARPEVVRLTNDAIARNPVPFPPDGVGTIVIRSTTAKKSSPSKSKADTDRSRTSKAKKKK